MIKIYKNYSVADILPRKIDDYGEYEAVVKDILKDVAARGDEALRGYARKFDGFCGDSLEVTAEEMEEAEGALSEDFKAVVRASAENIAFFHEKQRKSGFEIQKEGGVVLGQKYTPVAVAGEQLTQQAAEALAAAKHTFGMQEGKVTVVNIGRKGHA